MYIEAIVFINSSWIVMYNHPKMGVRTSSRHFVVRHGQPKTGFTKTENLEVWESCYILYHILLTLLRGGVTIDLAG